MAAAPGRGSRSVAWNRLSAALTLLMAPVVVEPSVHAGAHGYSRTLLVTVALGALLAAARLWRDGGLVPYLGALVLASTALVGQFVLSTFGGPTDPTPHWSLHAALLVALAGLLLVVLLAGMRSQARDAGSEEPAGRVRHPYAL